MTVYDFCEFFDFTCEKVDGGYIATDDQGVFHDREFEKPGDCVDMFDSMLSDYVDDELEYHGFSWDGTGDFYAHAWNWFADKETDLAQVVGALCGEVEVC